MPKHNFHVLVQMLRLIVVCSLFSGFVLGNKVCTNSGLQSHTLRYQLFSSSKNESWVGHNPNHLGLIPGHDHTWSESIPRKMLREEDEISWNKKTEGSNGVGGFGAGFLKEVSLHDVRLDPSSIHGVAQQTNLEYLLMLDVDRLVWSFRKTAGLETRGEPYGGWEAPSIELRGHFVGHYLSASAQMWASTHNASLEEKMLLLVSALSDCQTKIGTGYLSAFPSELFDRFEALKEVWAPYYTIHKILAGLLDQYTLAGNSRALRMVTWMVDYFYKRVQNVISMYSIERHWLSLNEETGGMNDVLYRLHIITGDQKHLLLAHLFDKPCFLGLLALKADDISGFHANTHIPIVIGAQLRYEITGEPLYKEIGTFFMDIVNSSHSYATGGTSDPKRLASTLQTENQESCTTYNMLKVARHLFRWTKEMAYADYYERALTNGVLGIQRGKEPGVMIYMLPFRAGGSKARGYHGWGNKFDSFWCCYGTGIETFSKLGDSIYFEEGKDLELYIIQYIPSTLNWTSGQILLTQKVELVVSWDQRLRVTITISSKRVCNNYDQRLRVTITISSKRQSERLSSTLKLRIPLWTHSNGSNASLNGQHVSLPAPGKFLSINKHWSFGDKITLDLPVLLRSEHIQDDRTEFASIQAFLYGPYLLAGLSSGDWDLKINLSTSLSDCFTPIPADYNSQLISLAQEFKNSTFVLTNSDQIMKMEKLPEPGTDAALKSTFRLVHHSKAENLVKLELFDLPDTFLSSADTSSSIFRLTSGLDGENGTVSLESESEKGCFIYSGLLSGSDPGVKLNCSSGPFDDAGFRQAASFMLRHGISEYDPISFVAKGVRRNFVLVPLLSLRDESYTVYFNTSV